jgi:acyl carrier protein
MDLGMDSLDKVNFQVFLESTFGLKLKEDMHITHPTVEKARTLYEGTQVQTKL